MSGWIFNESCRGENRSTILFSNGLGIREMKLVWSCHQWLGFCIVTDHHLKKSCPINFLSKINLIANKFKTQLLFKTFSSDQLQLETNSRTKEVCEFEHFFYFEFYLCVGKVQTRSSP